MSNEIKRKTERYLARKLTAIIQGSFRIVSSTGGGEQDDAEEIEPPFSVVTINESLNQTLINVWSVQGSVQVVTHMTEHTPTQHSELANAVEDAIRLLEPDIQQEPELLVFNGIDITSTRYIDNDDEKVRVTAIDFTAGVNG